MAAIKKIIVNNETYDLQDDRLPTLNVSGTTKYLREDGTWAVPPDTDTTYTAITNAQIDALFD